MDSNDLAININAILLSLQLRDDEKLQKTNTLLHYSNRIDCLRCLPEFFSLLDTYDSQVAELAIKVLMQMFYRHEETVAAFLTVDHVYSVFRSDTDDMLGGELLWRIMRWKSTLPNYPFEESEKLLKLLLRRTRQQDPRLIPGCSLRWWLVLMWRDFPRMRPSSNHDDERAVSPCVPWLIFWLASSAEPLKFKVPLLQVIAEEIAKIRKAYIDRHTMFTAWILKCICEAIPVSVGCGHLQLVFHFLDMDTVESALHEVLEPLDNRRLVAIFALLLAWTPASMPRKIMPNAVGGGEMYLSILCVFMRVYRRRHDPALMGTCLRLIASVGNADENVHFAITLLGLLKPEFSEDPVWAFSMPSFLDATFLRFGAESSLSHAFRQLGYDSVHPHLLSQVQYPPPRIEPKIFALDDDTQPPSPGREMPQSPQFPYAASPTSPEMPMAAVGNFAMPNAGGFQQQGMAYAYPNVGDMQVNAAYQVPVDGTMPMTLPYGDVYNAVPEAPLRQSVHSAQGAVLRQSVHSAQAAALRQSAFSAQGVMAVPPMPIIPPAPFVPPNHEVLFFRNPTQLPVGIRNFGNTCYLATVIQSMAHTDSLVGQMYPFILRQKPNPSPMEQEDYNVGEQMLKKFKHLIGSMIVTDKPYVGIDDLVPVLPIEVYIPNEQADPALTLRFIFDKFGSHDQQLIRSVFTGEITEHLQCQVCKNDRQKKEYFSDLVVTVPKDDSPEAQTPGLSIQSLLNKRFEFEVMTGDEQISCDPCQAKRDAGKWSELVSPPQHLVISMGRISFDITKCDMVKAKTYVEIEPAIMIGGFAYELYFVIYHQGPSAHSGHYLGIGRRSESPTEGGMWFHYDDSKVRESSFAEVQQLATGTRKDDSPYVLFYRCTMAPFTQPAVLPTDYVDFLRARA